MKQKRKVKSLLSQKKDLNGGLVTALLIVLGLALCLGSATLMTTSSVGAVGFKLSQLSYSGLDDKVEVLYNLQFARPDNLSGIVGEMYTDKDNDFYITSAPLTVNLSDISVSANEVDTGLYSNILGGAGNKVKSNNITVIGGSEAKIASGNDNAVILGGIGDEIIQSASTNGVPSVIVGGRTNKIYDNHNGNVIIGGKSNNIGAAISNSFILGGESNSINTNDAIVGGNNVTVNDSVSNLFVFSNAASFEPQTSNAFYLNVNGGVGINTGSAGRGVTVKGPVRFGEVDIKEPCVDANLGVIGLWSVGGTGCLVGCTKSSSEDANRWDLLDRGEVCQNLCDSPEWSVYCSQKKPQIIREPIHYNSFCTTGYNGITNTIVDVSNASPCTPVWDQIENVVFETSLIDAKPEVNCPINAANKCIYQCNPGYHLTGDTTGKFRSNEYPIEKCFKDCDLVEIFGREEWRALGNSGVIKHNEVVTGYNKDVVPCSYDAYSYNPITRTNANPTGYSNARGYYLDNGYGTKWYRTAKGIGLDNANSPYYRYELPETCTNNAHQQRLVCVNGEMYIASGNKTTGKLATGGGYLGDNYLGYAHSGYIYMNCHTSGYTCNLIQYDLTEAYINTGLFDEITTSPKDRNTLNGTRGTYKLCLDYIQDPFNDKGCYMTVSKTLGNAGAYDMHYEFKGCRTGSGYRPTERSEDDSRVCRKECTVRTRDGVNVVKRDLYEVTLYNVNSGSCLAIDDGEIKHCESETFKCDDGTWKIKETGSGVTTTRIQNNYGYSKCMQHGNPCTNHWVNTTTFNAHNNSDDPAEYSPKCHRMHAFIPYPNTALEGEWNKQYDRGNTSVNQNGNPTPIKWECEDNDWRYELIGCKTECYHGTGLNNSDKPKGKYMQYCEEDFVDGGNCPQVSNYKKAGHNYRLWIGAWNAGSWNYGTCTNYCDKGTYDNGSSCVNNPGRVELSYDTTTQWLNTIREDIQNGARFKDVVYDKYTYEKIKEGERYIECNMSYHLVKDRCVSNTQNCVGDLPYNAKSKSYKKGTTIDGTVKVWTYGDASQNCQFTCKDDYVWNGVTCVESCGAVDNLCTINYYVSDGRSTNKTTETVVCGTQVELAKAHKKCYEFDGWYNGTTKIVGDANNMYPLNVRTLNVTAVGGSYNQHEEGCAYKCTGGEVPGGGNTEHIRIKDDPGDNVNKEWMFVTGYDTPLGNCQWKCERGYMRGAGSQSGICVEKPCGTDSTHVKPTGNSTVVRKYGNKNTYVGLDGVKWTYKGTTTQNATQPNDTTPTLDQCEWTCQPGYTHSGSTCVKRTCYTSSAATARSSTLVPTIAHSKQGTGLFNVVSNLYWTGVSGSNPGPCEWVCESGYTRSKTSAGCQNKCVPIHTGQCMSDGTTRVKNNGSGYCSTGYASAIRTSLTNKYVWDCISNNSGSVCYPNDPGRVGGTAKNCYRCKPGYTGSACNEIRNASCNNDVELGCKYTGVTAATSAKDGILDYSTDSTIYWHCNGKNGGSPANGCKKCQYGYWFNGRECEEIDDSCGYAPGQCLDEHAEVYTGLRSEYYDSSEHEYTWLCQTRECKMCDEGNGYYLKNGSKKCMKCNNCAKNGWPYCFPIDFSISCDESQYTELSDFRYS